MSTCCQIRSKAGCQTHIAILPRTTRIKGRRCALSQDPLLWHFAHDRVATAWRILLLRTLFQWLLRARGRQADGCARPGVKEPSESKSLAWVSVVAALDMKS